MSKNYHTLCTFQIPHNAAGPRRYRLAVTDSHFLIEAAALKASRAVELQIQDFDPDETPFWRPLRSPNDDGLLWILTRLLQLFNAAEVTCDLGELAYAPSELFAEVPTYMNIAGIPK